MGLSRKFLETKLDNQSNIILNLTKTLFGQVGNHVTAAKIHFLLHPRRVTENVIHACLFCVSLKLKINLLFKLPFFKVNIHSG